MIDPRVLRTYLAVCRERSISGAARALNISQPSVSVAIQGLEARLGATLFERGRQGITLTPVGLALMRRAEAMESLLRDAESEVALAGEGVRGPLRIGGTPGALVSLAPDAIGRLEAGGRFALDVLERADSDLTQLLRSGEIEVACVTTGIEEPPPDIVERSIARDPFALIVGRANDRLGPDVSLKDVVHLKWVLPRAAGGFARQIEASFIAAGASMPRDIVRCDSLLTTKAIVRRSEHVTLLPRGVAAAELSIGVLRAIPVADVELVRSVGIRTLRSAHLSELAQQFIAALGPEIV